MQRQQRGGYVQPWFFNGARSQWFDPEVLLDERVIDRISYMQHDYNPVSQAQIREDIARWQTYLVQVGHQPWYRLASERDAVDARQRYRSLAKRFALI
jgi:uncharacterized ferritin-like protein (DUF455 family)